MTAQLATFLALLGLIAFAVHHYYTSPKKSNAHQSINPSECRSIITAETHPNGLPNQLKPLASRALPNKRLEIAFGIRNTFTSVDEVCSGRFVNHARDLVNLSSTDWIELSDSLRDAVGAWTDGQERIRLTSEIQALSLRVILRAFFGTRLSNSDDVNGHLVGLAEAINRAWMATKNTDVIPLFEDNIELQECLATIFPDSNFSGPEDNPLNLILPGFETMWRVVLRLFLEITFTTGRHHPEWADILVAFANNPSTTQFTETGPKNHIPPKHLINEALRLYPPTRRVYRSFKTSHDSPITTLSADIEAHHTSIEIWGPDAMIFNPDRWTGLTPQQRRAFMPFGSTPFVCPAKPTFGPRVIGLLVGALLRGLRGDQEWRVEGGVDVVGRGGRLRNERGAYDYMYLVKR